MTCAAATTPTPSHRRPSSRQKSQRASVVVSKRGFPFLRLAECAKTCVRIHAPPFFITFVLRCSLLVSLSLSVSLSLLFATSGYACTVCMSLDLSLSLSLCVCLSRALSLSACLSLVRARSFVLSPTPTPLPSPEHTPLCLLHAGLVFIGMTGVYYWLYAVNATSGKLQWYVYCDPG